MPHRIPSPGVAEVHMLYNWAGQVVENVFHVKTSDTWTAATLSVLCELFYSWWHDNMEILQSGDVSLTRIEAMDLTTLTGNAITYTTHLPAPGGTNNPAVPSNSTVTTKLSTGQRGRSMRGRSYFIGLPEQSRQQDTLTAIAQSAIQACLNQLILDIASSGLNAFLAVLSERTGGAMRLEGMATEILTVSTDPTLDSQRRRLPGRGR